MKFILLIALSASVYAQTLPIANSDGATFRTALNNALQTMKTNIDGKVPVTRTVNGYALSSNITLVKADLGLGNVDNTSDAAKPVSTATQTALDAKQDALSSYTTIRNLWSGSPTGSLFLRDDGTLAAPSAGGVSWGAISGTLGDQADLQSALSGKQATITGAPGTWPSFATVATTGAYSDLTGKPTLATVATTGAYSDLSGKPTVPSTYSQIVSMWTTCTGFLKSDGTCVAIAKSDVGLGSVDNTSDAAKPVSTATQTALDAKIPYSGATGDVDLGAHTITAQAFISPGAWVLQGQTNSAQSTPASGNFSCWVDSTAKNLKCINDAGNTSVTSFPQTCSAGSHFGALSAAGAYTCSADTAPVRTMGSAGALSLAAGTTYCYTFGQLACNATEDFRKVAVASAMTISAIYITTQTNQASDGGITWTLRKNKADTVATVTVNASAAAGTYSATSFTPITLVAGDYLDIKAVNASASTASISAIMLAVQ